MLGVFALLFSGIFWLPVVAVVACVLVILMVIGAVAGPGTPPSNP